MTNRRASIPGARRSTVASSMLATATSAGETSAARTSARETATATPFARTFRTRHLDRDAVRIEGRDGCEAHLHRGDGEDARAGAEIDEASPHKADEELEAEPGGRMRAGPEGAARIDDHRERTVIGALPRRPDPERPDADRPVKAPPRILPSGRDRLRAHDPERAPSALLAIGVGVGAKLDLAVLRSRLLEALGEELEHPRAPFLRARRRKRHADAP